MKYTLDQVKKIIEKSISVYTIEFIGCGNHSEAYCINNEIVIKLPKHRKASDCLKTEMYVLRGLEGKFSIDIPNVLFSGAFSAGNEEFVYFASRRLNGKKLSKAEFLKLDEQTKVLNAEIIAEFLSQLHNEKQVLPIKRKDLCLLHGDFSLNHIMFNGENVACGILDFGDSRIGKAKSEFIYLLDDEDEEEFGSDFGNLVLSKYESKMLLKQSCLRRVHI